jgi:hypothetical protein
MGRARLRLKRRIAWAVLLFISAGAVRGTGAAADATGAGAAAIAAAAQGAPTLSRERVVFQVGDREGTPGGAAVPLDQRVPLKTTGPRAGVAWVGSWAVSAAWPLGNCTPQAIAVAACRGATCFAPLRTQTKWGDIEFGFYPDVAPVTARHIFKLVTQGAYTGNHIFRVDRGFVAQVADVVGGRDVPLNAEQQVGGAWGGGGRSRGWGRRKTASHPPPTGRRRAQKRCPWRCAPTCATPRVCCPWAGLRTLPRASPRSPCCWGTRPTWICRWAGRVALGAPPLWPHGVPSVAGTPGWLMTRTQS